MTDFLIALVGFIAGGTCTFLLLAVLSMAED